MGHWWKRERSTSYQRKLEANVHTPAVPNMDRLPTIAPTSMLVVFATVLWVSLQSLQSRGSIVLVAGWLPMYQVLYL